MADAGNQLVKIIKKLDSVDYDSIHGDKIKLSFPTGIALKDKKLFITDLRSDNNIYSYELHGQVSVLIPLNGLADIEKKYDKPLDVCVSGNDLFIVESGQNKIWKYDLEYHFLDSLRDSIDCPVSIAISRENNAIYLANLGNRRIIKFDSTDKYINSFLPHDDKNKYLYPLYIHVDKEFLYVLYEDVLKENSSVIAKYKDKGHTFEHIKNKSISLDACSFILDKDDGKILFHIIEKKAKSKIKTIKWN